MGPKPSVSQPFLNDMKILLDDSTSEQIPFHGIGRIRVFTRKKQVVMRFQLFVSLGVSYSFTWPRPSLPYYVVQQDFLVYACILRTYRQLLYRRYIHMHLSWLL